MYTKHSLVPLSPQFSDNGKDPSQRGETSLTRGLALGLTSTYDKNSDRAKDSEVRSENETYTGPATSFVAPSAK